MNTVQICIEDIIEKEGNRANQKLEALSSVKEMGIRVPLIVYEDETKPGIYFLVDGHRRLFTAKKLGLNTVPAVVIPQEEAGETYAIANLDRMDLTTLDLYERAKEMISLGKSVETIADTLHVSKYQFNRFMKLDNLIPEYMSMLKAGKITSAQASEFASFPKTAQTNSLSEKWLLKAEAKDIRSSLNRKIGKSLNAFDDAFITWGGACGNCLECKFNRAADLTLFGSASKEESVCTDDEKLAMKLLEYSNEKKCKGIVSEYNADAWLEGHGIKIVPKDWASYSKGEPSKGYQNQEKYLSSTGEIVWMGGKVISRKKDLEEVKEWTNAFNCVVHDFIAKVSEEATKDLAKEIIEKISSISNKKVSERLLTSVKNNCHYLFRNDELNDEESVGFAIFETVVTKITDYSVPIWTDDMQARKKSVSEVIGKWEPYAVMFPGTKKEWEGVLVSRKKLLEALEKYNG